MSADAATRRSSGMPAAAIRLRHQGSAAVKLPARINSPDTLAAQASGSGTGTSPGTCPPAGVAPGAAGGVGSGIPSIGDDFMYLANSWAIFSTR